MSLKTREAVLDTRVRMLTWFLGVVSLWAVMATSGWMLVQRKIDINVRPALPNRSVALPGHGIDPVTAFQYVVFQLQSIYHWKNNGEEDFALNLRFARENKFISHEVYTEFRQEYFSRSGKRSDGSQIGVNTLRGRERIDVVPKEYSFNHDFVDVTDEGVRVTVFLEQKETINGAPLKTVRVRYQFLVVRNSESDANKYGMQIAERLSAPARVEG